MEATDEYRTKDLAEGALLLTKGKRLLRLEREGKIVWFVFEDEKACKKLSYQFWFGKCLVNAKNYYGSLTILKNRIFAHK